MRGDLNEVEFELEKARKKMSDKEHVAETKVKPARRAWLAQLPMPFVLACALLGPRLLVSGKIGMWQALGLGFACGLAGGLLITGILWLVVKLTSARRRSED